MSRTRRERTPMSGNRKRLSVKFKDPKFEDKFYARWVNDSSDRVALALEAGYDFVQRGEVIGIGDREVDGGNTDLNSKVSRVVNRAKDGDPEIRAFLMKQAIEFRKEDLELKEEPNRLIDQAVLAGKAGGADIENRYGDVRKSVG